MLGLNASTELAIAAGGGGAGTSAPSASSSPLLMAAAPDAPTSVSATNNTTLGSVTISWIAPANNGGSAITGYSVSASPGTASCSSTSATTCTITSDLTTGSSYTFSVTATNVVGTSPVDTSSSLLIAAAPGAPTGVTVVAGTPGSGTATISWGASSANGSPVTSYTATATDSTHVANGGQSCTTSTTGCSVTGLTVGDSYTFSATATNAVGTSPVSGASNSIVIPPYALTAATGTFYTDSNTGLAVTTTTDGDLLVLMFGQGDDVALSSISGGNVSSWTQAVTTTYENRNEVQIFYGTVDAVGSSTINITIPPYVYKGKSYPLTMSSISGSISAMEYSASVPGTWALDTVAGDPNGEGLYSETASLTTTEANELFIGVFGIEGVDSGIAPGSTANTTYVAPWSGADYGDDYAMGYQLGVSGAVNIAFAWPGGSYPSITAGAAFSFTPGS
jgi:hypothetical protein